MPLVLEYVDRETYMNYCNSDQRRHIDTYFRDFFHQPKHRTVEPLTHEGLFFLISLGLYSPEKNSIRCMGGKKRHGKCHGRCQNLIGQHGICTGVRDLWAIQSNQDLQGGDLYCKIRRICRPFLCESQHGRIVGGDPRCLDELAERWYWAIVEFRQWYQTRSVKEESEDVEMKDGP